MVNVLHRLYSKITKKITTKLDIFNKYFKLNNCKYKKNKQNIIKMFCLVSSTT